MSKQHKYVFFTDRNLGKQFPATLKNCGINVESHNNNFADDTKDEIWLAEIGAKGWYAVTRDKRIHYTPNEKSAVKKFGVGLFILIGKASFPELAQNFILTYPKIIRFIDKNSRPFIAKIYRSIEENKAGSILMWESFK